MDIPLTICTVIVLQFVDDNIPAYVRGKETFIFFGTPTLDDYLMVEEYVLETGVDAARDSEEVKAELFDAGSIYGVNKHIKLPNGTISTYWESR